MGINTAFVNKAIITILVIVLLFSIYSAIIPEAQTAGDEMNDSNRCTDVGCYYNITDPYCHVNTTNATVCQAPAYSIPLSGLFSSSGIVFLIIMAALLVFLVKGLLAKGKK